MEEEDAYEVGEGATASSTATMAPPSSVAMVSLSEVMVKKAPIWALRSVIKVFSTKVDPNYAQPWQMTPQRNSTGSAFIISHEKKQIMTNSHVISGAVAVYVRRPGLAKKFKAEILVDGKVCDLALLTVADPGFWDGIDSKPLEFVDVPELQSPISVVGYPVGGDSLCITKGIVSRVTLNRYSLATRLLSIQIDAAINPGNSGGPAFSDLEGGKVSGVAFCKITSAENIGYIIPRQVVQHFLAEYEQYGSFRGVPCPGFSTQDMENPAQRACLKVPEGRSGVRVVRVDPLSPVSKVIQKGDVIMEVGGKEVADDGTSVFREDERLDYVHLIRGMHIDDHLTLKILRDGQELEVSYPLALKDHLVPMLHGVDCVPSYLVVGGLVFTPLTQPFLEVMYGKKSRRTDIPVAVLALLDDDKTSRDQQVVILLQVLAHEINHGYGRHMVSPLLSFNGTQIQNLHQLAGLVDACQDKYLNFVLEGGKLITLDREEAVNHGPTILKANSISADRSQDVKVATTIALLAAAAAASAAAGPAPEAAAAAGAAAPSALEASSVGPTIPESSSSVSAVTVNAPTSDEVTTAAPATVASS